jgi:hypothetical protein
VPTKLPRHSITETPPVREALDRLRERGVPVELPDLVVRGARDRLREIEEGVADDERRRALRARLLGRMRAGRGIDAEALRAVRESGWTHA